MATEKTTSRPTVVGYYGHTFGLVGMPTLGGVVAYCREHPEIALRDFSLDVLADVPHPEFPPWKGLADGVVFASGFRGDPEETLQWIDRGGVPAVSISGDLLDPRLPAVFTAPASVARLATKELLRCGCRRLIHLGSSGSMVTPLRVDALKAAAKKAGCTCDAIDLSYSPPELDARPDGAEHPELLDRLRPRPRQTGPIGVLTLNDHLGRFVLRACEAAGLAVPEQVAVVSSGDTPLAFDRHPTMSSVVTPAEAIGRRVMEVLLRQIACGRRPRKPILVPAREIARRETTGVPSEPDDVAWALELLQRQACSGMSVEEIVALLPVSRRTLERKFRERLGRSPSHEIFRIRLAQARTLLSSTQFTVTSIAKRTGFHDHAALSKFFRGQTGMTPTEYRRQVRCVTDKP